MNDGLNFSSERNTGPKAVLYSEKSLEIASQLFSSKTTRSGRLSLEEYKKVVESVGLELSLTPRYGENYTFGRSSVTDFERCDITKVGKEYYWYIIWPDSEKAN